MVLGKQRAKLSKIKIIMVLVHTAVAQTVASFRTLHLECEQVDVMDVMVTLG